MGAAAEERCPTAPLLPFHLQKRAAVGREWQILGDLLLLLLL